MYNPHNPPHLTSPPSSVVVKKGAAELPGITDDAKPRRLGPKRATSIRKLFNLKNVGESLSRCMMAAFPL